MHAIEKCMRKCSFSRACDKSNGFGEAIRRLGIYIKVRMLKSSKSAASIWRPTLQLPYSKSNLPCSHPVPKPAYPGATLYSHSRVSATL